MQQQVQQAAAKHGEDRAGLFPTEEKQGNKKQHGLGPIQCGQGGRLQQMLRDNLLDVAVIEGAVNGAELETRAFRQDRLVLVLPQEHPLAVLEHITLAQVLEYPLLVREEGSAGRRCLEQVLARRGLQADRRWESIDTQALLRAVAQGLGVAFLPRELAEGMPGVVIRTLADEDFCRENVLVWHRHKRLSAELLELMELLEK
jgi:DNA-binding transcriptional LysR family regulator